MSRQGRKSDKLWNNISTVGPLGLSRYAPGTMGAIPAVPLAYGLHTYPLYYFVAISLLLAAAATYAVSRYLPKCSNDDPQEIVADEFIGCLISCLFVPQSAVWLIAAFLLFRAFDIVKPWPVSWIDRRIHGALGVIGDDVVAGLMSGGVLAIINRVI